MLNGQSPRSRHTPRRRAGRRGQQTFFSCGSQGSMLLPLSPLDAYSVLLQTSPLATKAATQSLIWGVGDVLAQKRKGVLHNIHKSNVLKSSVLWNEVMEEVGADFPYVEIKHILVDAAATYLCLNPGQFDVMVMENMFGDILSDQGGGILGSLGLMPSACIGPEKAYYEPSHGSAPDIAGQKIANPYSMIGSVAMMLEMSFGMDAEARNVWQAMQSVFGQGYSTPDLSKPGSDVRMISTNGFGDLVVEELRKL